MLKILGGIGKGLSLFVPKKDLIRPTSVLLKRRLFDKFQHFDSIIFIDGCAGSGGVGLEAWSRGCQRLYLLEANRQVFTILIKNVERLQSSNAYEVNRRPIVAKLVPVEKWLRHFKDDYLNWRTSEREQTIFFFDPPYQEIDLYKKVLVFMQEWFEGLFWIESDYHKGPPFNFWGQYFESFEQIEQGSRYIIIAHR